MADAELPVPPASPAPPAPQTSQPVRALQQHVQLPIVTD